MIRISCITGADSPTLKFLGQLLCCPLGACVIMIAYGVAKLRGRKMSLDAVFNLNGILLFALFITLTLAVPMPGKSRWLILHGRKPRCHLLPIW